MISEEQIAINRLMCGNTAHSKDASYIKLAIEALEKQIPKEVSTNKYRNDFDWTCNVCDTTFQYIRYTSDKPNYCPNCGQAIKWE